MILGSRGMYWNLQRIVFLGEGDWRGEEESCLRIFLDFESIMIDEREKLKIDKK